jgi:Bacterial Ig-like domain (group 3)
MRNWLVTLLSAAAVAAFWALTSVPGQATARPAAAGQAVPSGHWGAVHGVRGAVALLAGDGAALNAVSCSARGECTAGGSFGGTSPDGNDLGFVADERHGVWGAAIQLPSVNPATGDSVVESVSCASPGNCAAVGESSPDLSNAHTFVVSETGGRWGMPQRLAGAGDFTDLGGSKALTVSCVRHQPGDCAAGGFFADLSGTEHAVVADESGGTWDRATPLEVEVETRSGVSASTQVTSVSCASPGNCAAAVAFRPSAGFNQALVADETNGTWGPARPIPGMISLSHGGSEADAVSCPAPGSCAVTGKYTDDQGRQQVFAASEQSGAWGQPTPFPLSADSVDLPAPHLSCGASGDCAVAGTVADTGGGSHAMVAAEAGGAWVLAARLGGVTSASGVNSGSSAVSCAAAGECTVVGSYTGGHLFTAEERDGAWQPARQLPGETALLAAGDRPFGLTAVSCATPGNCAAGGSYSGPLGFEHPFVTDKSTVTSTALRLSAARARFGREQAVRITVTVASATGGTPAGRVAVTAGKAAVCMITLKAGRGSCAIGPKKLRPGKYRLLASYRGSTVYAPSNAAKKALVVTK